MRKVTVKYKTLKLLETHRGLNIKGLKRRPDRKFDIELQDEVVAAMESVDPDPDVAIEQLITGGTA